MTQNRSLYGQKSRFVRANLLVILRMMKDGLTIKKMTEIIHDQAGENISRYVISKNLAKLDLTSMRIKNKNPGRPSRFLCNVGFGDGQPLYSSNVPAPDSVTSKQHNYKFNVTNQPLVTTPPQELQPIIAHNDPIPPHGNINHQNVIKTHQETNQNTPKKTAGKKSQINDIMAMFETGSSPAALLDRKLKASRNQ